MKKLPILLILFPISIPALAQEPPEATKQLATELGLVYEGMPKEDLYKTGFTDLTQKDYRQEGNEEWITFSDWTTEERGDTITFHLEDGKVKDWKKPGKEPEAQQSEI